MFSFPVPLSTCILCLPLPLPNQNALEFHVALLYTGING
jgi:hypothetical protein